jgi:cell division transport system permease protein
MSFWLKRHVQTLIAALGRLWSQPLATAFTVLVIGIALALPACLQLVITNVTRVTAGWSESVSIAVYLKLPTEVATARSLAATLRKREDVSKVELITAEAAFADFRRRSGFGAALETLTENPLPHVLVVKPASVAATPARLERLADSLRSLPAVDLVQLDTAWVQRLDAIVTAFQRAILLTAVLLALGAMAIVGNTIRLEIQTRKSEIEIVRLVGASNGFIRRPFLYSGAWYGLGGALVAWLTTAGLVGALGGPIERIAGLYASSFRLTGLSWELGLLLLVSGIALGWLGSFIIATRHLVRTAPR